MFAKLFGTKYQRREIIFNILIIVEKYKCQLSTKTWTEIVLIFGKILSRTEEQTEQIS